MKIGEFLKPSKGKIIIALAIPYVWAGLILLLQQIYYSLQNILIAFPVPVNVYFYTLFIVLSFLIESLLFYPFSCSISLIYTSYKKKTLNKTTKNRKLLVAIVLSILIFNPLTLTIVSNLLYYSMMISSVNQSLCGILVKTVLPDSPASRAGITPGSIIYKVNGTLIDNTEIIQNMHTNYKAGQVLEFWIYYGNGTYGNVDVTLGTPPSNLPVKGFLGINFTANYDSQCNK